MKLRKEDAKKIEKLLSKKTTKQVAVLFGVSREAVSMYCARNGIKMKFSKGQGPTKNGLEILESIRTVGIEKTAKRFKKSVKNIKQTIANWKFKGVEL